MNPHMHARGFPARTSVRHGSNVRDSSSPPARSSPTGCLFKQSGTFLHIEPCLKKNAQGTWSRKETRCPAGFPLLCAKILVCLLQVMLLVCFDHQLMEHDNISIGQAFHWLHAQAHHRSTILDDLN